MEKFYITTPIYYANGSPHIGHAYTTVAADILARWQKNLGKEVVFLTGMDEHGSKVAEKAAAEKLGPQEFTDHIARQFRECWQILSIENTDFIRTTEERHKEGVVFALKKLKEAGAIYEKKYTGLYCSGCEAFVTEKDLDENGLEPLHQKKPILIEEKNWFFKLSDYLPQIKQAIENDTLVIEPTERKNEVLGLFEQGLADFSISRSRQRVEWGIPLPFDETQTAYVWVDALLNYVTALGYGSDDDAKLKKYWPADAQLIGQDILKFHAVYWPAILMALQLSLPKRLIVHGFFTINGQKMSKSLGNIIDPYKLSEKYGADATRYLLITAFPFGNSGDVSEEKLENEYNNLANTFGNLVRRVFNIAEKSGIKAENFSEHRLDEKGFVDEELGNYLSRTISEQIGIARNLNAELDAQAPWKEKDEEKKRSIISDKLVKIYDIANMLEPVMPEVSRKIRDAFKSDGTVINPPVLFPKNPPPPSLVREGKP